MGCIHAWKNHQVSTDKQNKKQSITAFTSKQMDICFVKNKHSTYLEVLKKEVTHLDDSIFPASFFPSFLSSFGVAFWISFLSALSPALLGVDFLGAKTRHKRHQLHSSKKKKKVWTVTTYITKAIQFFYYYDQSVTLFYVFRYKHVTNSNSSDTSLIYCTHQKNCLQVLPPSVLPAYQL